MAGINVSRIVYTHTPPGGGSQVEKPNLTSICYLGRDCQITLQSNDQHKNFASRF